MMRYIYLILIGVVAQAATALNPHPRIWLTTQMLTDLTAKVNASDPDWVVVKAKADAVLSYGIPVMTITGASNSNPVQFTITETVPFATSSTIFIGGGTGAWSGINAPSGAGLTATRSGTHTFTVPVNSTSFGSFSGQALATFQQNGCAAMYICYDYEAVGWADTIPPLAIAYALTGTQAYATKAIAWLDYVNAASAAGIVAPESIDSGFPSRFAPLVLALVYDWCFDRLNYDGQGAARKSATAVTVNLWHNWVVATPAWGSTEGLAGYAGANYWGGHVLGFGTAAYATYDENSNASAILTWVGNQWTTEMGKAFSAPVAGTDGSGFPLGIYHGGLPLEWNYGGSHVTRLLEYMHAVLTATGTPAPQVVDYQKTWSKALLYELKPDRWQVRRDGIWSANVVGPFTGSTAMLLAYLQTGSTEGQWMQWLFTHLATPTESTYSPAYLNDTGSTLGYVERLLYRRPSATATDYRVTQPTSWFADDSTGRLFWRSDWTDSASWATFYSSPEYNQESRAMGSIEIARGSDQLIVNSQNWAGTGDGVGPGSPSCYGDTAACGGNAYTSSLYFADGGTYILTGASYLGGQGNWGRYVSPTYKIGGNYSYVRNNLTSAYDHAFDPTARTLRYWFREFVPMGGGVFVVWDRVKASSSSYTKVFRWQLSSAGTPVKNGNVVSNVLGSSAVFIVPVLPVSPAVNIIRNQIGGQNLNWRAEITDSVSGTDLNALTVIYTTTATGGLPVTSALAAVDANHVGVQIADTTAKVAVFPVPVTAGSGGTYVPTTYTSVTFTTTHGGGGNYLIAGLTPGTYSVLKDSVALSGYSSVAVGPDGTLFFSSTAGSFSVVPQNSPPPASPCDLNGDGSVDIVDLQLAINQASGKAPCGNADLNGDGRCDVIDVQRVINAAIGGACRIGQ